MSSTDLRLSSHAEQNIISVLTDAGPTGQLVQPSLTPRAFVSTQKLVIGDHIEPGHRALIVAPVEQSHGDPAGRRHHRGHADLDEGRAGRGQLPPAAPRRSALGPPAQTREQLPRLLTQDETQQQQSQSGHQQEHHAVDEVQLIAGTLEDRRGEDLLSSCCQQSHQPETQVALFVGDVQKRLKVLLHL